MLPAPNLDDRTFQGLVDEAKRLVQTRCPEWTDHNVSDPGVTLIEAFAQMVDQLIYRLNRVPDLNYVKFLELIGVELRPPAAGDGPGDVLALGAPAAAGAGPRRDPGGHPAHRHPRPGRLLDAAGPRRSCPARSPAPGRRWSAATPVDLTAALWPAARGSPASRPTPTPGDALLVGLVRAVPSCAVTLRMTLHRVRRGRRPAPPAAASGRPGPAPAGSPCELDHDDTGGLNKDGDVVLHVPEEHQTSIIARERAGWLRCRLVEPLPEQPTYTAPPRVNAISAFTIGGDRADGERRGACTTRRSAAPTARPVSGSRCCAAPCSPPTGSGTLEVRTSPRATRRGPRCGTSPSPDRTTGTTASTTSRARCSSGRPCARRTAPCRSYGAVPAARRDAGAQRRTAAAAGGAATSRPVRCAC